MKNSREVLKAAVLKITVGQLYDVLKDKVKSEVQLEIIEELKKCNRDNHIIWEKIKEVRRLELYGDSE